MDTRPLAAPKYSADLKATAAKLVAKLLRDLNDREGFDLSDVDSFALEEWKMEWQEIILKHLEGVQ